MFFVVVGLVLPLGIGLSPGVGVFVVALNAFVVSFSLFVVVFFVAFVAIRCSPFFIPARVGSQGGCGG